MQGAWLDDNGAHLRVYAPQARRVDVETEGSTLPMTASGDGHFDITFADSTPGRLYRFRVDGQGPFPDPCSASQPEGPHGPSQLIRQRPVPTAEGAGWKGIDTASMVLYECHVGTMSPQGTFDGLVDRLDDLRNLGVTALQIMPIAEFGGRWNWGYDGVDWYAPFHGYGGAAGLRRLVDACHRRRLGVILDVVYNHLGPDGNYLGQFNPHYFTNRHDTPWGDAVNFDGDDGDATRRLVTENVLYWLQEFDIDGLRLDATHQLHDQGSTHILQEVARVVHGQRGRIVVAEDERNDARVVNQYGLDGVYADDFHHVMHVLLTGEREGYYGDFEGTVEELARTINQGWLYEGAVSRFSGQPRGTSAKGIDARRLLYCLQNHDQVGNRAAGERLHQISGVTTPRYMAATAVLLTVPMTPLLFMGQEFAASSPFQFFTDHTGELGQQVSAGRRREFEKFADFHKTSIPDPQDEATFRRSCLRWEERNDGVHAAVLRQYKALLALRQEWRPATTRAEAAGPDTLKLTLSDGARERLLLAHFSEAVMPSVPNDGWALRWSSDDERSALYER